MKKFSSKITARLIAEQLGISFETASEEIFDNVSELGEANSRSVCFFENSKYITEFQRSKAGLIFVPENFTAKKPNTILFKSKQPYAAFMMLVKQWLAIDNKSVATIANSASIAPSAILGNNVSIGENVVISAGVKIAENTTIEANTVIKENVVIGKDCHIYPNVTIYQDCEVGNRNILHAGVVIGADGFGYIFHENIHHKVPQVGNVILQDNVEIGANSCIDRGAISSTVIGAGTKIDNLVQIGHNCKIGNNSICCAQVGIAGSTNIGNIVYLAGQVGVAGHLTIEDNVMVGAQAGIINDIKKGEKVFGTPAIDARLRKKIMISEKKLPEIARTYNRDKRINR